MKTYLNAGHDRQLDPGAVNQRLHLKKCDAAYALAQQYLENNGMAVLVGQRDDLKMMVASVHNHLRRESYQKQCYDKRIEKNIIGNNTVTDLPEAVLASEGACPEQFCLQNEMKWQMTKAVEQLPDMHYRIIWWHFFQGDSYQKIAEEYHISKSTVRDYVKRSLA